MNQRHRDLNTNELEKLMAAAGPWLEKHGNKLIYAVCAAMLAFAAYYYWAKSSAVERSAGWGEFITASEPEDYANIASRFKGTPPGKWALLTQANENLQSGLRLSFSDREGAVSDLKSAQEKFKELLDDRKLTPDLEERALFGLARSLESLAGDDTSKAVEAYETLIKRFPSSIFKTIAEEQIETLKANDGQRFYAWFVEQDPKPTKPSTPFDNLPPGHPPVDPGSLITLPPTPDMLKLPEGSAPVFPEGLSRPDSENAIPPAPPKAIDSGADPETDTPEGTAPPLPENP
jgi:hypothetical protein